MPVENLCVGEFGEIPDKAPQGSAIDITHPCIGCHGEVWASASADAPWHAADNDGLSVEDGEARLVHGVLRSIGVLHGAPERTIVLGQLGVRRQLPEPAQDIAVELPLRRAQRRPALADQSPLPNLVVPRSFQPAMEFRRPQHAVNLRGDPARRLQGPPQASGSSRREVPDGRVGFLQGDQPAGSHHPTELGQRRPQLIVAQVLRRVRAPDRVEAAVGQGKIEQTADPVETGQSSTQPATRCSMAATFSGARSRAVIRPVGPTSAAMSGRKLPAPLPASRTCQPRRRPTDRRSASYSGRAASKWASSQPTPARACPWDEA